MRESVEDSSLQYKDHKDFFEEYFKLRIEFVRGLSSLSFTNDKRGLSLLYKSLDALINWTDNYIFNPEIELKLNELHIKVSNFNYANTKDAKEIVLKFKELNRLINIDHEKAEILPKKLMEELSEEEKFYKEENNQPLRYAKKAFTDLILKRF